MPHLPNGWTWSTLGQIGRYQNGRGFSKREWDTQGRPIIRIQNLTGSSTGFNHFSGELEDRFVVPPGSLLVSWAATLGVYDWRGPEGALNQHIFKVESFIERGYHRWLLDYALADLRRQSHGSGMVHVTKGTFDDTPVPIPPLAEQRRIVEAIEAAFSNLDAGAAYLQAAKQRLARLNEAAVWSLLLRSDQITITENGLPALPAHWDWQTLGALADVVGGMTKDAKRQTEPGYVEVPYLRVANVQRGWLDLNDVTTIRVAPERAKSLRLEPGDVLFNEGGDRDKLGRGWVWEGQIENCIHQNHVFRARIQTPGVQPKYISLWGNTFGRRWFEHAGKQTTNLASISMTSLRAFPVPVPPPDEQATIVAEVEAQQSIVSSSSIDIEHQLRRAAALRRSVLAAAFSGDLVRQDPTDEPAELLMKRVASERPVANRQPRSRRPRRASEGIAR